MFFFLWGQNLKRLIFSYIFYLLPQHHLYPSWPPSPSSPRSIQFPFLRLSTDHFNLITIVSPNISTLCQYVYSEALLVLWVLLCDLDICLAPDLPVCPLFDNQPWFCLAFWNCSPLILQINLLTCFCICLRKISNTTLLWKVTNIWRK